MITLSNSDLAVFGPTIAIIDDRPEDVNSLIKAFEELKVGYKFYNVDVVEPRYPERKMKDVNIVFLDLHYNEGFGAAFDPHFCVDWLQRVVPENQFYILVVWSRDEHLTDQLKEEIQNQKLTLPAIILTKRKGNFRVGSEYDVEKLLNEITSDLRRIEVPPIRFYGKILEVEEDAILVNCLINENPKVFEVRRFDLEPFNNSNVPLESGSFIGIKISTRPGSRTIEFYPAPSDIAGLFVKPDVEFDFNDHNWINIPE